MHKVMVSFYRKLYNKHTFVLATFPKCLWRTIIRIQVIADSVILNYMLLYRNVKGEVNPFMYLTTAQAIWYFVHHTYMEILLPVLYIERIGKYQDLESK